MHCFHRRARRFRFYLLPGEKVAEGRMRGLHHAACLPPLIRRCAAPSPRGGVSPFGEGRVSKVASTHFERFGNLAMLFFPQAPVLKCMEAVRMVTDLLGSGQTCSVVFCPAALEFCLTRMARSRSPARSRPPGAPDRSID